MFSDMGKVRKVGKVQVQLLDPRASRAQSQAAVEPKQIGITAGERVFSPYCRKKQACLGEHRLSHNCATLLLERTSKAPVMRKNMCSRISLLEEALPSYDHSGSECSEVREGIGGPG